LSLAERPCWEGEGLGEPKVIARRVRHLYPCAAVLASVTLALAMNSSCRRQAKRTQNARKASMPSWCRSWPAT